MRVAALYDVHGMPWALEAALADVESDAIVFGGDHVWAIAEVRHSGWPLADVFVEENLARPPSRNEAIVRFGPKGT